MVSILIVEDSLTQAERLRLVLEEAGFRVEVASSAEQALALAERSTFDLVISDVVMPGENGYELCRSLKQHANTARTPVILLTTLDDPMAIIDGLVAGADNFLTKPYEPEDLLDRVRKLLENKALRISNKVTLDVEVAFLGKRFTISSGKEQIIDLLISTFEDVVRANTELKESRAELALAKAELEQRVAARTVELREANRRLLHSIQELRESESRFHLVADTMPALLWMTDEHDQCTFVNKRWLDYTGRPQENELGRGFIDSVHPDQRATRARRLSKDAAAREPETDEYRLRGADGNYRRFLDTSIPRFAADGRYLGRVGVLIDIEERHQLEQQLHQAQKMEVVGQLTGGLAHDFNNLLLVVIGNLELIQERLKDDPQALELAKGALQAGWRGAELTRKLLAFSRNQTLQTATIQLNELVSNMTHLLRRTLGERIEVEFVAAKDLWPSETDPALVESAIMNLAVNARDAMPDGGRLIIETANAHLDTDYTVRNPEVMPGDYVVIAVTDTGVGIAPENLSRVFEPFFTTKEINKGSGLGLSMIYGFAKQSGGHVKIYSEVGHGTTVRLYLPRSVASGRAARAGDDAASDAMVANGELVLVVEDNSDVRHVTVAQLADLGYRTVEAPNARIALDLVTRMPEIDLLFTDVVMPGDMTGYDLGNAARTIRPGLRILYTSGFTEGSLQGGPTRYRLSKPYRKQDLALKLRAVLRGN